MLDILDQTIRSAHEPIAPTQADRDPVNPLVRSSVAEGA